MVDKLDSRDAGIARIAARQHGVVTAAQLAELGLSREAVRKRVRRGRLHRLHRGVYAVGHAAPSHQRNFVAAVFACGEGAALSHGSAAVLWQFLKPLEGPVHVTSPSMSGKVQRAGIVLHRSPSLLERDERGAPRVTTRHRIPVTTPRRTIEDLPATLAPYLVRRAKRQAEFLKYNLHLPTDRSRSDLETAFLAFLRRHHLPPPEVNVKLGRHEVDFFWRNKRLVVETDAYSTHGGPSSFEDDRERDLRLRRMGYRVLRYTEAQLTGYPAEIAGELGAELQRDPVPRR